MEQLKLLRSGLRTAVTKQVSNLETLIKNKDELRLVKQQFSVLEDRFNRLKNVEDQIVELLVQSACSEDELVSNFESADVYLAKFASIQYAVDELNVGEDSAPSQTGRGLTSNNSPKYQLPKMKLKEFSGEFLEYLPFWSLFSTVHEDPYLRAEDKFHYLLQSTVEGSKARQLVDSYPPTAENYPKVIEALKSRYGREDLLIEVYIRELLKLVLQNAVGISKSINLASLFDKLESHLRSLESLGVTNDKFAAVLLPLIESSLPEDILRTWQRSGFSSINNSSQECATKARLDNLMNFLRNEVEAEERIELAKAGFGVASINQKESFKKEKLKNKEVLEVPTASTLINGKQHMLSCIFCKEQHNYANCEAAKKMSLEQKYAIIRRKRRCLGCLKFGHFQRNCVAKLSCPTPACGMRHLQIVCPKLYKKEETVNAKAVKETIVTEKALANYATNNVILQTVVVWMFGKNDVKRKVRVLFDTGSERSYVTEQTVSWMGYEAEGTLTVIHSLFGGVETQPVPHNCYKVRLGNLDDSFRCNFEALSQANICEGILSLKSGKWMNELKQKNVILSDVNEDGPIEVLVGADIAGKLLTGKTLKLSNGLVAVETLLGWTVMGRISQGKSKSSGTIFSMFSQMKLSELWDLELIGIRDPCESRSREAVEKQVREHFENTIGIDTDGRYEVQMPWIEGHDILPSYFDIAVKRLHSTVDKLKAENFYTQYAQVFKEWIEERVIEEIPAEEIGNCGHYLPHRHVIRLNSSSPVRPVFDASTRCKPSPSLNMCLEKGPNLIENIPKILLVFRLFRYGVTADIRRAFLQISLCKQDRDFLRFLWLDESNKLIFFRHRRVVFGVTCSPYLLEAVIAYHLNVCKEKCRLGLSNYCLNSVNSLIESFYVDNCVTSVDSIDDLEQFTEEAKRIMWEGKFDLRAWENTLYKVDVNSSDEMYNSNVLGLEWNRKDDTLGVSSNFFSELELTGIVSKRKILSAVHKPFDVIGFCCPVSLVPKILLQRVADSKLGWDNEVDGETARQFLSWYGELHCLKEIKLSRWLTGHTFSESSISVHTFCDASTKAYATAIFLRVEYMGSVRVQLIQAKSRIAPNSKGKGTKGKLSVPRLELVAATIGARLYNSLIKSCRFIADRDNHFWSDSSTVLTWIWRENLWGVFVGNRVKEIRRLTDKNKWRYVPGNCNPADLPSRGCSAKYLVASKWWEGPKWLALPPSAWPLNKFDVNEKDVEEEKRKGIVSSLKNKIEIPFSKSFEKFSCYLRVLRVAVLVIRFIHNCRSKNSKKTGLISSEEVETAELFLLKLIQKEAFSGVEDKRIICLKPFFDNTGLIRIDTKITNRDDHEDFIKPIVLPCKHYLVLLLIEFNHKENSHVGTQTLLSILRERFWILKGRQTVKSVVKKCVTCQKSSVKSFSPDSCPLPVDRVRDAKPFEVTGVDYAGPIILKGGTKTWICLFTCAVYRAVHLELVSSLSTESFIQVLRRFTARRGRPSIIYSDNGRNFVGANNLFKAIDWNDVGNYCCRKKIKWKFSAPSAAWWGGWWERLVRVMKGLLRRILGRASITYEEMLSVLCDVELVINKRPLTYVSEDPADLKPLTPLHFLLDGEEGSLVEADEIDASLLSRKAKRLQTLRQHFRKRFRSEYLGLLVRQRKRQKENRFPSRGDVVMIGDDGKKRVGWPLARIVELLPGRDGVCRTVKLRTGAGEVIRPVQRVYPLELASRTAVN